MRYIVVVMLLVLAACSDRTEAPIVPDALTTGELRKVYVGTTRGFRDGVYGIDRSDQLDLINVTVSLPPNRMLGEISYGRANPDPDKDFVLTQMTRFGTPGAFRAALAGDIARSRTDEERDVTVFVHGFNSSFTDAVFRMAQLAVDTDLAGPVVTYAWPSRANPLGYEYDSDSALFARDGLGQLLKQVKAAGARRIVLIGHSMGGRLVLEVLRQMEIAEPGWSARSLEGVLLMSPDVNVDVFRSQTARFEVWPEPFIIFISRRDRLLRLSAQLRGEDQRLGNVSDVTQFSDLPVLFIDVTNFRDGGTGNHFVPGSSPEFLRLVRTARQMDDSFLAGGTDAAASVFGGARMIGRAVSVVPSAGNR